MDNRTIIVFFSEVVASSLLESDLLIGLCARGLPL